jgi:4-carboxymuconolactone decarboxylase
MTGPRFKPIPPEQMTAEQKRVVQALTDGPRGGLRGPFPALLRIPALADRVRVLGDYVRFEGSLPAPLRELAILVVARFWSAQYEWYAHSQHAVKAGVDPSVPEAIAKGERPSRLSADEALVYDVCNELLNDRDVSDKTFAAAVARFGETTVLELVSLAAYYGFVSLILNLNRTPIPEGATPLPPLGGR